MLKIFPPKILSINGDTIAVFLILLGIIAFFFLPLIDNKPAEKKGKVITALAYLFIVFAVAMSLWSLLS
jgi:quinol-cytochrome oxidoreductase complex cytochrome b subunit